MKTSTRFIIAGLTLVASMAGNHCLAQPELTIRTSKQIAAIEWNLTTNAHFLETASGLGDVTLWTLAPVSVSVTNLTCTMLDERPPGTGFYRLHDLDSLSGCQPTVIVQPLEALAGDGGGEAVFQVKAAGESELEYQWFRSDGGDRWFPLVGETQSLLRVKNAGPFDDGARFRCLVINRCGSTFSESAALHWAEEAVRYSEVFTEPPVLPEAVRNIRWTEDGAVFGGEDSGIDYSPEFVPATGTFEIELRTTGTYGFILDTRGIGSRVAGDAVLYLNGNGQAVFAIDPLGGQNPGNLPGVHSKTRVNDGVLHTVGISYGTSGVMIYVDGVLEEFAPAVTTPLVRSIVTLGAYAGSSQSFSGVIRSFRASTRIGDIAFEP